MRTFALVVFCALGIGLLVIIGRYAARDVVPVESREQAATLSVVYHGSLYAVAECQVQVDLPLNLVTATCKDVRAQIASAPSYPRTDSSSWLDVHVATRNESLLFSDCVRYGEVVQCDKLRADPHDANN